MARKILLADDSVTAQNMGRKILADAGYEVITVNNGSAALKKIAENKPDLIVLDVYMPGYSGLEVCQRLKEAQETARIPVLLTVGKLEPFKPEEAQRVRAEGFIVKPFEASELLSALSKLEDKVVPRPEPSKPGRFARAMAAVEADNRREGASAETGWRERISFPSKKKKAEVEKTEGDAEIYNPVNRDLRTTLDKPAAEKEAKAQQAAQAKTSQDLPDDVTPEELAAIAAAMAQMQGSWNAQAAEKLVSEALHSGTAGTAGTAARAEEQVAARAEAPLEPKAETPVEVKAEAANELKAESVPVEAGASSDRTASDSAVVPVNGAGPIAEESEEVPATMAATAEMAAVASGQGPRWMAVPVALGAEESAISLEQEMHKAYAAFAAAEANHPGFVEAVAPVQAVAENTPIAEALVEPPVAVSAVPEPERSMSTATAEPAPAFVVTAQPEAVSVETPASGTESANPLPEQAAAATLPASVTEVAPSEMHAIEGSSEVVAAHEIGHDVGHQEEPKAAEFAAPVETAAVAAASAPEPLPASEPEPEVARAAAASSAPASIAEQAPQHESSETVASTAAAWASWHQIRDAGDAKGQPAESSTPVSEANVSASASAAEAVQAVTASAEKIVQEASAVSSSSDPTAIASIVESVLENLRPKLVEEISRKMAEKK